MSMILRSGKVVTNLTTIEQTNKPKCSYCNKSGHKINKCTSNERIIKKINDEIVERAIFSHMVIPDIVIIRRYLRLCLCSNSEINLLMLCYYTKIKKYSNDYKKLSYINLLVDYYFQKLNKDLNTLTHMLSVISDEKYEKYTNEIVSNSVSLNLGFEAAEIVLQRVYHYRPPQRKFNIQLVTNKQRINTKNECPICYETYSQSEIIRTECSHNYCKDCLISYFKSLNNNNMSPSCACCRKVITTLEIRNKKMREEIQKKYISSEPEQVQPQQQQGPYPTPNIQQLLFQFVSF